MDFRDRVLDACKRSGVRLNTDLGQHFLIDESVLHDIIAAAGIAPGDRVLEIGMGLGVLTERLLASAATVTSIEIDQRWIPVAKWFIRDKKKLERLEIINGNALQVPFPTEPYRIVANIPYHITSPLLRHAFLECPCPPLSVTILIQREVAEKICDPEQAGLLTVIVGLFGTPRLVRKVPPSCFVPPPKVDSAVVHIEPHPTPVADAGTIDAVMRLAKSAFSQKRKMLRNTVGKLQSGMERLQAASIDPERRPETLSIAEWIALARTEQAA